MTDALSPKDTVALFDRTCPGMGNGKIAELMDVHRNTVSKWRNEGIGRDPARKLIALALLRVEAMRAELLSLADEHGLKY